MPPFITRSPEPARRALRAYFYSGWGFFIPYLIVYLIYYWQKWPVNPAFGHLVPCLLHVYWGLHFINVILAVTVLHHWWRGAELADAESTGHKIQASVTALRRAFRVVAPWTFLALLFYIPGVYFEWPSDPWEHLCRINEWRVEDTVGAHYVWLKSSYFIEYSLLGQATGLNEFFWLDIYHTGIALLLCWQYYRLARSCQLSNRVSMIFVLIQALCLGNSVFSFFRYYGISSSIYAQLGAVAIIRSSLEFALCRTRNQSESGASPASLRRSKLLSAQNLGALLRTLLSISALFLLILMNHLQGVGIACIGIAAVVLWRIFASTRPAILVFGSIYVLVNASVFLLYRNSPILDSLAAQGYLNQFYGFDLLSLSSAAGHRMLQIVGAIGLVELIVAALLVRHNAIVAWLTLTPYLALLSPAVSIPLALTLTKGPDVNNVITFQRMLFSVPLGLVTIISYRWLVKRSPFRSIFPASSLFSQWRNASISALLASPLLIILLVPVGNPVYNHFWNALYIVPKEGSLRDVVATCVLQGANIRGTRFAATSGISFAQISQAPTSIVCYGRGGTVASKELTALRDAVLANKPLRPSVAVAEPATLYSARSFAGRMSGHWLEDETALAFAGAKELLALAQAQGLSPVKSTPPRADEAFTLYQ